MWKNKKRLKLALTTCLVLASFCFVHEDKILRNVFIMDIDVGGLTSFEAIEKVKIHYQQNINLNELICLKYNQQIYYITAQDIDFAPNFSGTVASANQLGNSGNIWDDLTVWYYTTSYGYHYSLVGQFSTEKLRANIARIVKQFERSAKNAHLIMNDTNEIICISEKPGIVFDEYAIGEQIASQLNSNKSVEITIKAQTLPANINKSDLQNINRRVAGLTLPLKEGLRKDKINILVERLNNNLLFTGKVFSWRNLIFHKDDLVLPDEESFLATALFQLVQQANLEILQIAYESNDAEQVAIRNNLFDFRFKNNLQEKIYIFAKIEANMLKLFIFGEY